MRTNLAWVPSILLPIIHPPFVAMRIYELSAIDAFAARGDAGDQHPSPDLNIVTAAPTSSTTPARSWPRIRPGSRIKVGAALLSSRLS
jgi:hypothetical protein